MGIVLDKSKPLLMAYKQTKNVITQPFFVIEQNFITATPNKWEK
jgi:hypothetical protein